MRRTHARLCFQFFSSKFQASFASTEFMERRLASFKKLSVFRNSFIFDQENGGCRNILQINMHVVSDIKSVYIIVAKKERCRSRHPWQILKR